MDFDRVALLRFGFAVRRLVGRLYFQFLWRGLLCGHKQAKDENGQPLQELHLIATTRGTGKRDTWNLLRVTRWFGFPCDSVSIYGWAERRFVSDAAVQFPFASQIVELYFSIHRHPPSTSSI
jgi:hypothetical protein